MVLCGALAHAQGWNWATPLMTTGAAPRLEAVAALPDGGALVCGEFNDTLRAGTDTIVTHGNWDGFLARLDNAGAVLWLHAIGGALEDGLNDITVDAAGNAYAAASFRDTVEWNGTMIQCVGANAALIKFDLDGNVLWWRRAIGHTFAYTVSVSSNGRAFLGGVLTTDVEFDGIELDDPGGIYNAFVAQYAAGDGTIFDADVVSGSTGDFGAYGMDVDADGNVYFTGYSRPQQNPYVGSFMGKRAFGSGIGWTHTVTSASGDVYGRDVSVAPDGFVYYTGTLYQNVDWMGTPLGQFGRYRNAYLARFASDGSLSWVKQVGANGTEEGLGVVSDGLGHVYWTGGFMLAAPFDTITVQNFNNDYWSDIFTARYGPDGTVSLVNTAGGNNDDMATAIDKRVDGPVIVGGEYRSYQWNFDEPDLFTAQGTRLFVASMSGPDDDLSTAMPEAVPTAALRVHPVPATDALFIALEGGRGAVSYTLFDASGRTAHTGSLSAPFGTVGVAGLANGLYTLRCVDGSGTVRSARVVVEH